MTARTPNGDVLGVALAPATIVAATPSLWERDVALNGGANGARDALGSALADAARAAGFSAPALAVALMPPLAETRTIALPPLAEADRNVFLARNAARYFVGARGAQVVGTAAAGPAQKAAGTVPVVATTTTHQLLQALQAASDLAGCTVRSVVPAEAAWAAAAVALWPSVSRGTAQVAVVAEDRVDLLTLANGVLAAVRRFRGASDAEAMTAATGRGTPVAVIGTPDAASAVADALQGLGVAVVRPDAKWAALAERPDALAARFSAAAAGPEIRTEESRQHERAIVRRTAWTVFAFAAAALVVAATIHYRGIHRELAAIRAARNAIRPQVEASLVGRSSVDAAMRQVAALAAASRQAPRWSVVLADLATQLSDGASIVAFRARGDSIVVDGVAAQAAPVFDEIGRVPGVMDVRATQPVRRQSTEGEDALEHFSIGARVAGVRR